MKVKDIIDILDKKYPLRYAYDWDNCGLLIGDMDMEVEKCLTTLEVTDEVISEAVDNGANLIISHHPVIFSGMKRITTENFKGAQIIRLIRNSIAVISLHTNFDIAKGGTNDSFCKALDIRNTEIFELISENDGEKTGMGRIGEIDTVDLKTLALKAKKTLGLDKISVVGDLSSKVSKVAVCTGSGADYYELAKAKGVDCLLTGDMKYHTAQDALHEGVNIIDCSHFGSEEMFKDVMYDFIKANGIEVIKTQKCRNPIVSF